MLLEAWVRHRHRRNEARSIRPAGPEGPEQRNQETHVRALSSRGQGCCTEDRDRFASLRQEAQIRGLHKYTKSTNANDNHQVTNPSATNQGTSGPITWTPSSTGTYFYQCSNHQNMWGEIKVN